MANKPAPTATVVPVPFDWFSYLLAAPKHVWTTIERVAIAMLTTRATVPVGLMVTIVMLSYKLESADLKDVINSVVGTNWFAVLGWVMFLVALSAGYTLFQWRERMFSKELNRLEAVRERAVKGQMQINLMTEEKQ